MNKLWLILLLGCSSVSCLELENICANETKVYRGIVVNSFYRIKQNLTLGPIKQFLVGSSIRCDLNEFNQNKTALFKYLKIKNSHNRMLSRVYSEHYLNKKAKLSQIEETWRYFILRQKDLAHLKAYGDGENCLNLTETIINRTVSLFATLASFYGNEMPNLTDDDGAITNPEEHEILRRLEETINAIQIDHNTQTFAFHSEYITDIYEKQIVLKDKFELTRNDSNIVPFDADGVFYYDLILPFNTTKHSDTNCFLRKSLPLFYHYDNYDHQLIV